MQAATPNRAAGDVVSAIEQLDLGPVKFKLMDPEEGPGWSSDYVERMAMQYKRFLILLAKYPGRTIAPTKDIDKFWHGHILDTMKYMEDCQQTFGFYLHHFPYFGMRGDDDAKNLACAADEMASLYATEFGEPLPRSLAFCIKAEQPRQDAAFCIKSEAQAADAAFCIRASQPKQDAAFCIKAEAPAADAAFCIRASQPKQDAAFCIKAEAPAADAAFCIRASQPKQDAAFCIKAEAPAADAAFCIRASQPKQDAAFCIKAEVPAADAAFCIRASQPKQDAAFCIRSSVIPAHSPDVVTRPGLAALQ